MAPDSYSSLLSSSLNLSSTSSTTSLKVVIVGDEGVGKTSFVRRLVADELGIPIDEVTPNASSSSSSFSLPSKPHLYNSRWRHPEGLPEMISTGSVQNPEVGLDIYQLDLSLSDDASYIASPEYSDSFSSSNETIQALSIWDFMGKSENLCEIQKMFFTPQTLYIVVWDMAAKSVAPTKCEFATASSTPVVLTPNDRNNGIHDNNTCRNDCTRPLPSDANAFQLGYDEDSDNSDYDDIDTFNQKELRRTRRMLERDIDKKVQSWIDRIQAITPGATILPIATHMDCFMPHNHPNSKDGEERTTSMGTYAAKFCTEDLERKEIKNRCRLLKERIAFNEARKVEAYERIRCSRNDSERSTSSVESVPRPIFHFGNVQKDGQVLPHAISVGFHSSEDKKDDDDDMSLGLHSKKERDSKEGVDLGTVREFVIRIACMIASTRETLDDDENIGYSESSSLSLSLATDMLRGTCQKMAGRSKILQTEYLTKKCSMGDLSLRSVPTDSEYSIDENCYNDNYVFPALNSMHCLGELCYFGSNSSSPSKMCRGYDLQVLSDFVVLDPTWLVESIDFILQYAREFVEKITSFSNATIESSNSLKRQRLTNCPTIEKEKVRSLWKNRLSTKQGLRFAEQYFQFQFCSENVKNDINLADKVFEFIQCLLVRHEVFIPLSYQKSDSRHFFLPGLLGHKVGSDFKTRISSQNSLSGALSSSSSSILMPIDENCEKSKVYADFAESNAAYHGLIFDDTAPQSLMERIIVHTIKSLSDILNANDGNKIFAKEIYCWKDSFRLKLEVDIGDKNKVQTVEINSLILEGATGDTCSRMTTCETILATYFRGHHDENCKIWMHTCSSLRLAVQKALDEMQIEYREGAICPECLRKKPVSEIGTWTFGKIRSAMNDKEAFIRCRHGHRIEMRLDGFLYCQLVGDIEQSLGKCDTTGKRSLSTSDGIASTLKPRLSSRKLSTSTSGSILTSTASSAKRYSFRSSKNMPLDESLSTPAIIDNCSNQIETKGDSSRICSSKSKREASSPDSHANIMTSSSTSSTVIEPGQNKTGTKSSKECDGIMNLKLARCEAKMKRVFFRKSFLSLENLNLTECQIPVKDLNDPKFGRHLQSLSLAHNMFETIPKSLVYCLPNLRSMNLSHCFIYKLPKRWNLPMLKRLNLSHNLLIDFPEETMLLGLLELEELNLSGNKLAKVNISANTKIMTKLRRLDLSSNELTSFPTDLNRFKALKYVDIKCNNI